MIILLTVHPERRGSSDVKKVPVNVNITVDNSTVECISDQHPEVIGRCIRMRFEDDSGKREWYEGIISSHNMITGNYGIYFPRDGLT